MRLKMRIIISYREFKMLFSLLSTYWAICFRILKEAEKRDKLDQAKREREAKHQQFMEEKRRKQEESNKVRQEEKMKKMQDIEMKRQQNAIYKEQVICLFSPYILSVLQNLTLIHETVIRNLIRISATQMAMDVVTKNTDIFYQAAVVCQLVSAYPILKGDP